MQTANAKDAVPEVPGWVITGSFPCLGFILDNDGGYKSELALVKSSLWKALWRNLKHGRAALLPQKLRLRLMQRAVQPIAEYRFSRWAPAKQLCNIVDRIQRALITQCLTVRPIEEESPAVFVKWRGRLAATEQPGSGPWSKKLVQRVVNWNSHILRDDTHPAKELLLWHDTEWLRTQRMNLLPRVTDSSWTSMAGRTGTRAAPGKVQTRWQEGVVHALSLIS